jgi:hypothetical protein
MQGRYITHQAMRTLGARERITSVTSFRPKCPWLPDDIELRTVRPVSDLNELYSDVSEYRLGVMNARFKDEFERLVARRKTGAPFDTVAHNTFLEEAIAFLNQTKRQLVEKDKVKKGFVMELSHPDAEIETE